MDTFITFIAGHLFDEDGRCTLMTDKDLLCRRKWTDIMHCDESCVGQPDYAHRLGLTATELEQIRTHRAVMDKIYEEATRGVATGSGPTASEAMADIVVGDDTTGMWLIDISSALDGWAAVCGVARQLGESDTVLRDRILAIPVERLADIS